MFYVKSNGMPTHIAMRTDDWAPLLRVWRRRNPGRPWKYLLDRALSRELKPLAGKRYKHLLLA